MGKKVIIFGIIIKNKYGNEKPNAILKKINKISKVDAPIEKPIVVPKKGALQGVANKVAKAPEKIDYYDYHT